ncbi:uncharacterized protein [Lolium perenne]|uniref:uncharacterized protein isoform X2 n=1 Tax=Lolium perenne TaxID=4522 RepID=UPI0021F5401B|nr:protein ACCELERATED CELL DEATH 6-like isoform X2 [Lolium perenne]
MQKYWRIYIMLLPVIHHLYGSDIQKLVKVKESMDSTWLNFVVSNMRRQDAHDFRNTKCLGWRHYVDSEWTEQSFSASPDPVDLKNLFYRGSILYNASQSHMVFIPVFHDQHNQWTLYAFNMCDQKLSILDSLQDNIEDVTDPAERHQKTRCNVCDALTITMNFAIDFRSWEYQFPRVPKQQDNCDSGFFVFNFMRLWDGYQLVRWFPTESRELRKDFLAYILSCKDNNVYLLNEVSLKIKELPGEMMDCILQEVGRDDARLSTGNQGEHGGVGPSNNAPSDHAINIVAEPEVSTENSITLDNAHSSSSREASAVSSAPDPTLASSDFLSTWQRVTSDGDGLLHIAARFENYKLVNDILLNHKDLAKVLLLAVNNRGETPLHCAAAGGSEKMVTLFLGYESERDTDEVIAKLMRAQNLKGETCLHEAVRHGNEDIVNILILKAPLVVQMVDNESVSPLYLATTLRRTKIVSILTERPYNAASCAGPAGKTALHAAVVLLDKGLIKTLLDWNASLTSQRDESGSTPLHFLASLYLKRRENNILEFFCMFLGKDPLFLADSGIVELIMDKDPLSPLYADSTGSLPIHIAAAHGRLLTVIKLLKECPYCDSSRNASGQTFLHVAVEKKKPEIVRYVCKQKKIKRILNAMDQNGNTALHLAVLNASEDVVNNSHEAAVNNASEKIFCTLMRNSDVDLNFANKEGHTPLDLAFLSLHPKVISMKGLREWIFFDLLHGKGDFGVCSWDRLAGNVVEPDWEKESERVGKSASMLAVCAVLILNAALLAPFNVLKQMDTSTTFNVFAFQTFVVSDSIAFVCSVAATFFCARAGFAMSNGWARLKNLITGTFALGIAALALIITVALALFLVLPGGTGFTPIIIAGAVFFLHMFLSFVGSWMKSTYGHLRAIWARAGTLRLICILLFQRSAILPVWVVPSGSTSLIWSVAFVVATFGITISVNKFGGGP